MAVRIITDSTADIPLKTIQELGITVIPHNIIFGHESLRDRVDISINEFYRRLEKENVYPTTTQPAQSLFKETYRSILDSGDEAVAIIVSSCLSGTYSSAFNAASQIKDKGRIKVIDSKLTTLSMGLVVIEAAMMAQEGASLDEVVATVKELLPRSNTLMAFDTLTYLSKGGKLGKAQGLLGSMLSVKPVLTLKDGVVFPVTRFRSFSSAIDYLYTHVSNMKSIMALGVGHATTKPTADNLALRLGEFYPHNQIYRSRISPVLSTYIGPNILSVSFIEGAN